MHDEGLLFQDGHLRMLLEAHAEGIKREIEAAPEDHVMQVDEIAWAQALAERYAIEAPELKPRTERHPLQPERLRDRRQVHPRS